MLNKQKEDLRILCTKRRHTLNMDDKNLSFKLIKNISEIKELKKVKIIASYVPIKTEISVEPLNNYLISIGKKICLPVIFNNNKFLIFRSYDKKNFLKKGKFGIPEPDENREEIIPELILTPCLAFDQLGYRLGYGGGYYDRTFMRLRKLDHAFISVAVAYEGQKIKKVTRDHNDQKIDYILTEKNLYRSK